MLHQTKSPGHLTAIAQNHVTVAQVIKDYNERPDKEAEITMVVTIDDLDR